MGIGLFDRIYRIEWINHKERREHRENRWTPDGKTKYLEVDL
jgi:hypothetical protein